MAGFRLGCSESFEHGLIQLSLTIALPAGGDGKRIRSNSYPFLAKALLCRLERKHNSAGLHILLLASLSLADHSFAFLLIYAGREILDLNVFGNAWIILFLNKDSLLDNMGFEMSQLEGLVGQNTGRVSGQTCPM